MVNRPKLLFLGHQFHLKTKSSQFMVELFQKKYDVECYYFNPEKIDEKACISQVREKSYDVLVVWQLMPSLKKIQKIIQFKHIVYFPMYDSYIGTDGVLNKKWREYKKALIICFSRAMERELNSAGFSTRYIQFFPKPEVIDNWGNLKKVFFWQRTNKITINTVLSVLNDAEINTIHIHRAVDPSYGLTEPPVEWQDKITYSEWFDNKEDMIKCYSSAAIYFAPRVYEGIGMSFLEAMAAGRCVIAPNTSTMNEYIHHGMTGYLYDIDNPQPIHITDIETIQKNTYAFVQSGYEKWQQDKEQIFNWITDDVSFKADMYKSAIRRLKSAKKSNRQPTKFPMVKCCKQTGKESYYFGPLLIWRIRENMKTGRKKYIFLGGIPVLTTGKKKMKTSGNRLKRGK